MHVKVTSVRRCRQSLHSPSLFAAAIFLPQSAHLTNLGLPASTRTPARVAICRTRSRLQPRLRAISAISPRRSSVRPSNSDLISHAVRPGQLRCSLPTTRALTPQLLHLRRIRYRQPPLPQQLRVLPDHLEPRPYGPAREKPPVHVLQDHA